MHNTFKILSVLVAACWVFSSCLSGERKESGPLKEFNGRVEEVTGQILKVKDGAGRVVTFDNRTVTYVGGNLMAKDSVCVSYRGVLDNGTVAIVAEFVPGKKHD